MAGAARKHPLSIVRLLNGTLQITGLLIVVLGSLFVAMRWTKDGGRDWGCYAVNQSLFRPGVELWGERLYRSGKLVLQAGEPASAIATALGAPDKITTQTHFGESPWECTHYRVNYSNELVVLAQNGRIRRLYMGPNRPIRGF